MVWIRPHFEGNIETPQYKTISKKFGYEIRQYKKINTISVKEASTNNAFRQLFRMIDGKGNFLKESKRNLPNINIILKTVLNFIKGDEKIPSISAASIIAKVSRDQYMKKMHTIYPQYNFIENKGYGTEKHYEKIFKLGLSPIHRKTFKIQKQLSFLNDI